MKPIKLKFQAFLSYKDEVEIDFEKFDSSIFLIEGDTGSGKTTIFDAMCYALYGQCTNNDRASHLKSDYADVSTPCYVEFTFLQNGKEYTIRRSPEQKRPAKHKTKDGDTVTEKAAVIFTTPEGAHNKRIEETNKAILDVVKLNVDDFRKTMMIAQGKFSDLVKAKSKDRLELLREILQTGKFVEFTDKITKLYNDGKKEIDETNHNIDITLSKFKADDEELKNILATESPSENDFSVLSGRLQNEVNRQETAQQEVKKKISEIEKELTELNKKANEISTNNNNMKEFQEANGKYKELLVKEAEMNSMKDLLKTITETKEILSSYNSYTKVQKEFDKVNTSLNNDKTSLSEKEKDFESNKAEKEKCEGLKEETKENEAKINKDNEILADISKRDALIKEINALEKGIEENQITIDQINSEIESNNNTIDTEKNFISSNKDIGAKIENVRNDIDKLNDETKKYDKLESDFKNYLKKEEEYKEAFSEKERLSNAWEDKTNEKNAAEEVYRHDVAGYLANSLTEGQKCPVCGSIHHPEPANHEHRHVSKEDLDRLFKEEKKAYEDFYEQKHIVSSLKEACKLKLEELLNDLCVSEEDKIESTLRENKARIMKSLASKTNEQSKLEEIRKKIQNLEKDIESLEKANTSKQKEKEDLNSQNDKTAGTIETKKSNISELEKKIGCQTKENLEADIEKLTEKNQKASDHIQKCTEKYNQTDKDISSLKAQIKKDEERLPSLKNDLSESKKSYEDKLSSSSCPSIKEKRIENIIAFHNTHESEEKSLESETSKYDLDLNRAKTLLDNCKSKGYDKLTEMNATSIQESIEQSKSRKEELDNHSIELSANLKNNLDCLNTYKQLNEQVNKKGKKFGMLEKLYQVADGKVKGKNFISFEKYYQSLIFSQILDSATRRLNIMTNGQFSLLAHTDASISKETMLEIDVFDTNTGQTRPANNLSGGETFMASLSLAMGLSEISCNRNGARELDCLFIDEGFGTLGKELVNDVVRVLKDLSRENNRMIGVISHVSALGEQISKKISVSKSSGGSKISITA